MLRVAGGCQSEAEPVLVLQTVVVVVLLALDFWTVRNVSGRVLVGLRFWNQVDEDGTSFWVFEHRNVSHTDYSPLDARPLVTGNCGNVSIECHLSPGWTSR